MYKFHKYYTYILVNNNHTVFYTGVTNDLERRCREHKLKLVKGFTQKYNVCKLVYYEVFDDIEEAIHREKQIKRYMRKKKIQMINSINKQWNDLYQNGKVLSVGIPHHASHDAG